MWIALFSITAAIAIAASSAAIVMESQSQARRIRF
jgi:hypothetical protein